MAVVVTVSLSFGHFAGSEHGQSIRPHFLRLRRAGQFGKQVFKAAGMVSAQQHGKMIPAADAPASSSAFHAIPDQCEYVAFHAAEAGVMYLARRVGLRDFNAALVWV